MAGNTMLVVSSMISLFIMKKSLLFILIGLMVPLTFGSNSNPIIDVSQASEAMNESMVTVEWKEHDRVLITGLWNFLLKENMVDTNVTFRGQFLKAHRLILSIFLPTIQQYINDNILELKLDNVADHAQDIQTLIEFAYNGRVSVAKDRIDHLVQLAESLNFEGFAKSISKTRTMIHSYETSLSTDSSSESVNVKVEPKEPTEKINSRFPINNMKEETKNDVSLMVSRTTGPPEIHDEDPLFRNWNDSFSRVHKTFIPESVQIDVEPYTGTDHLGHDVIGENTDSTTSQASRSSDFSQDSLRHDHKRKPMTREQREAYNIRRRKSRNNVYENETLEERKLRLERQRIQRKRSREALICHPSYRERCRIKKQEYRNRIIENETPEERERRLEKQRIQRQKSCEAKRRDLAAFREENRIQQQLYRNRKQVNETPEDREQRLERQQLQRQKSYETSASDVDELREERRIRQREYRSRIQENETCEERERRLERQRVARQQLRETRRNMEDWTSVAVSMIDQLNPDVSVNGCDSSHCPPTKHTGP